MKQIKCKKCGNNVYIQIGDKPSWNKPVLNIYFKSGEGISIPILRRDVEYFEGKGIQKEG